MDKIMSSISDTVDTKIALKTDGEPALVQVHDRVISVRTQPTIPESPSAYDPQANGGAERGVGEVRGQLRKPNWDWWPELAWKSRIPWPFWSG